MANEKQTDTITETERQALRSIRKVKPIGANKRRVRATPVARRYAEAKGIDLADVAGYGPNGRIEQRDVERYIEERRFFAKKQAFQNKLVPDEAGVLPDVDAVKGEVAEEQAKALQREKIRNQSKPAQPVQEKQEKTLPPLTVEAKKPAKQIDQASATPQVNISPLAEAMAEAEGISIDELIPGSGPDGRIVKDDVTRYIAEHRPPEPEPVAEPEVVLEPVQEPEIEREPEIESEIEREPEIESEIEQVEIETETKPAEETVVESKPEKLVESKPIVTPAVIKTFEPEKKPEQEQSIEEEQSIEPASVEVQDDDVKTDNDEVISVATAREGDLCFTIEVDMTEVKENRKRISKKIEKETKCRCTYTDFLVKAVCVSLIEVPGVNNGDAIWLGVGVPNQDTMVYPTIKFNRKDTFASMITKRNAVLRDIKEGITQPEDYPQGTFALANLGLYGLVQGTVPVFEGQNGSLCAGDIIECSKMVEGQLQTRPMMRLSLSFRGDQITIATAGQFLQVVKKHMENPRTLLY